MKHGPILYIQSLYKYIFFILSRMQLYSFKERVSISLSLSCIFRMLAVGRHCRRCSRMLPTRGSPREGGASGNKPTKCRRLLVQLLVGNGAEVKPVIGAPKARDNIPFSIPDAQQKTNKQRRFIREKTILKYFTGAGRRYATC